MYAAKDGVITSITVYDGKAQVHVGDAVLAGEELITGILRSDEEHTLLTRARGEVLATVLYRMEATVGPTLVKPVDTGETHESTRVGLLGWELASVGFTQEEALKNAREEKLAAYAFSNCFLPITAEHVRLYAQTDEACVATEAELKEAALLAAEEAVLRSMPEDARILSKESETVLLENGAVRATVCITAEENIGEIKEIEEPYGEQD